MAKAHWTGWRNILPNIDITTRPESANDSEDVKPKFEDIQRVGLRIDELEHRLREIVDQTVEGRRKYIEFEKMQSKAWDDNLAELKQVYGTASDIFRQICPTANVSFPEHTKPDTPTLPDENSVNVDVVITQIRENLQNE